MENTNKLRSKLRWKCDNSRAVLERNFGRRNWIETEDDSDWNFYWGNPYEVKKLFNAKTFFKLNDTQIINHFPNFYELTRKDCIVKNIKKYKKQLQKENSGKTSDEFDFLPSTYILPGDMSLFIEDYKRSPKTLWILKPANRAQGQGVVLINKLSKVKKLNFQPRTITDGGSTTVVNETYVISKYIDNPMLINGKKFDLRLYVLVTSYLPLKVWWYKEGFARFCNEDYTLNVSDLENIYAHLTNVSIQKKYENYNEKHGGKWSFTNLMLHIEMVYGLKTVTALHEGIIDIIVNCLKAVQSAMHSDKHCFELYGFDVIIDENFKPWLIEINASPSLSGSTTDDKWLKTAMINDLINIVVNDKWIEEKGRCGTNASPFSSVGGFSVIYDEAKKRKKEEKKNAK